MNNLSAKKIHNNNVNDLNDVNNVINVINVNDANDVNNVNDVIKNLYWNNDHDQILIILHKYSNELYKKYHDTYIKYRIKLKWYRIPIFFYLQFLDSYHYPSLIGSCPQPFLHFL